MPLTPIYKGQWNPNTVYDSAATPAGFTDEVQYQGALWVANFYNVGQNPMAYSSAPGQNTTPNNSHGSAGPGYAWSLAPGQQINYDVVVPSWGSTTNLKAGYTSASTVSLFWQAAEVKGVGDVSSYDVYATNNSTHVTTLAGTTTSTSFTVNGLAASTSYTFTVDANDLTGTSGPQSMTGIAFNNAYTWNENPGAGPNPALTLTTHAVTESSGKYFSPYLDMTLPSTDLLTISANSGLRDFTLAFLQTTVDANGNVVLTNGAPSISWGGLGTRTTESAGTILQEVKAVQAEGGTVTISIGGYSGLDAAVYAAGHGLSAAQLAAEYQSVITTYGVNHLDFDIENVTTVNNTAANHLRDQAIVFLENANPDLHVTFTLATTPNGLSTSTATGNDFGILQQAVADGVKIDVVNIMAMDYYDGNAAESSTTGTGLNAMYSNAVSAAQAVENQLVSLGLTSTKVGITPMIGQNDDYNVASPNGEVFTLADAQALKTFAATTSWVAGLGEWELPRDTASNANHLGSPPAADSSGVVQSAYQFASIFSGVTTGTPHAHAQPADFNGDAHSDILWTSDNGAVSIWDSGQMGNAHFVGTGIPASWHAAGKADFDGNGQSDVLWQNDNGMVSIWDNGVIGGAHVIANAGSVAGTSHISGTGDFDGNGKSDILWRDDNGKVFVWDDGQSAKTHTEAGPGFVASSWHISATGDFDGNGLSDILWRNDNGAVSIWDDGQIGKAHIIADAGVVATSWHISGTGDFDGNGHGDILWRNDSGAVSIWDNGQLGGAHVIANAGVVANSWHIAGTGDFDGNHHSDILWHNDSGATSIWDNGAIGGAHVIANAGVVSSDWHIA